MIPKNANVEKVISKVEEPNKLYQKVVPLNPSYVTVPIINSMKYSIPLKFERLAIFSSIFLYVGFERVNRSFAYR